MDHDFTGPSWAEHHRATSRTIADAIDKLSYAFERLQALRYEAPWQTRFRPADAPSACPRPDTFS